jgi:pimeloyl-ACP methyl ester carboxylesterase
MRRIIISNWVEDILSLMDRVAEGPVVMVASSQGGWFSTYVASIRPDRVKALVLIGPGFYFPNRQFTSASESGMIDDEKLEEFRAGAVWPYETKYGTVYFTYKFMNDSIQYEIHLDEPIKVTKCFW